MVKRRASTSRCKKSARSSRQGQKSLARSSIPLQKAPINKNKKSKTEAQRKSCRTNRSFSGGKSTMGKALMCMKNKKCRPWCNTLTTQINSRSAGHHYSRWWAHRIARHITRLKSKRSSLRQWWWSRGKKKRATLTNYWFNKIMKLYWTKDQTINQARVLDKSTEMPAIANSLVKRCRSAKPNQWRTSRM